MDTMPWPHTTRRPRRLLALAVVLALAGAPPAASAAPEDAKRPVRVDFELYDLDGKLFSLERARKAGGVELVAIDFFDLACAPCKKALPEWKRLQERYARRGLRVVVVALRGDQDADSALAALRAHMAKLKAPFAVVFDKYAKVARQYGVIKEETATLPQAFLVDREGKLLRRAGGHKPIFEAIAERLR